MNPDDDKRFSGNGLLATFLIVLLGALIALYFFVKEKEQPSPRHIDEEFVVETVPTVEDDVDDYSCRSIEPRPEEFVCPH